MGLQATTTAKPRKKLNRTPKCKTCRKTFRPSVGNQKFCKPECAKQRSKASKQEQQHKDRMERAKHSFIFYRMAKEAIRAGTLDVLYGHTLESLCELHRITKLQFRGDGLSTDESRYHLAHIHPVKSACSEYIGLFHPANIFVCPKQVNQKHSASYYGGGKAVHRSKTKAANFVADDAKPSAVIPRIIAYLGESLVAKFVTKSKVQATERTKLIMHLELFLDELGLTDEQLYKLSTVDLKSLKQKLNGKPDFAIAGRSYEPLEVLALELERMANYVPDLAGALPLINKIREDADYEIFFTNPNRLPAAVEERVMEYLWSVLHGKQLDMDYLETLATVTARDRLLEKKAA